MRNEMVYEADTPFGDQESSTEKERERLRSYLGKRIFDTPPRFEGSGKDKSSMGGALVGAVDAKINRPDPPLMMERILIEGGKSIVLAGKNGSGKSTFFDGFMEQRHAHFSHGSHGYHEGVHGKKMLRIARLDQEELLEEIGDIEAGRVLEMAIDKSREDFPVDWEDPDRFEENVANQATQQRVAELLGKMRKLFEVDMFLDRKVSELSGGERTKLSLTMLLASEPDVLFLDEPTNHLDLESVAKLTGLFETYKRAGIAIVSVSHVEWFLDMAGQDGTLELKFENGKRTLTQSSSPYSKYTKKEKHSALFEGDIHWDAGYTYPLRHGAVCTSDPTTTIPDSPLINVAIPTLHAGEITVLSGKNGTGKTKLMQEVVKRGSNLIRKEKGLQAAYLPQFWPEDIARGTVEDFFWWIKEHANRHSEKMPGRFLEELRSLGFGEGTRNILSEPLSSFSGGEQRLMWFVAASIFEGTDVLVLDEPTNHMDQATMRSVARAISSFPGGVVLSTHDLRLMRELGGNAEKNKQGITNLIFERNKDGKTSILKSDRSPLHYAEEVIAQSQKTARRIQL